jgi:hypothetical protein
MDGVLLWNRLYRVVTDLDARFTGLAPRRGHPDEYSVGQVALCWLWSALHNLPLSVAVARLKDERYRRAQRALGVCLPAVCPHPTTLRRRSLRRDFWLFVTVLGTLLVRLLAPDARTLLLDSSPLPVPYTSRDPDADWGHHHLHGYRWHTLVSADRIILVWSVHGANEHELTVAPTLVAQAAKWGWRPGLVSADTGYDSEPLHREVRDRLGAMLVAPFNSRGGEQAMKKTPLRRGLRRAWSTPAVKAARRLRPEIDRMYSVLKSGLFGLFALPPWVRGQNAVERWLTLKVLLYHTYLLNHRAPE